MKALARKPSARFATARDFAVALERASESAGLLATTHEAADASSRRSSPTDGARHAHAAPRAPGARGGARAGAGRARRPFERDPRDARGSWCIPGARGAGGSRRPRGRGALLPVAGISRESLDHSACHDARGPSERAPRRSARGSPVAAAAAARASPRHRGSRRRPQPRAARGRFGRARARRGGGRPPAPRPARRAGALPDPRDGERRDRPAAPRRTRAADPPTQAPALPAEPATSQARPPAPPPPPASPPVSLELEENPYLSR
jgi:hypothetical protein